ncbi:MAG: multicopper oxidase domain-containing protein, partial [Chloroflexi bacterium]|nr:multicopper oxidase domain-containing protein [Chloroflexota bacterium]
VGETLEVVLHNEIPGETISLAFPGQNVLPDLTGVPQGGSQTYGFDLSQAGTFLYEAGMTPNGARQVAMGLAGPLIVESAPPPYAYDQEVVLVLGEVDPAFNADPLNFSMLQFKPKYWLMNGLAYPDTGWIGVAPDSTVLVRYLNAGAEYHSMGLLGLDQEVMAADGKPQPFPMGAVAKELAPGQTLETLVRIPVDAIEGLVYPLYDASLHQHNNNQRLSDGRVAFGGMLTFLQVTGGLGPSARGPVASDVVVVPPKTTGVGGVTLSATLTDDDGNVVAYEFLVDTVGDPDGGTPVPAPAPSVDVDVLIDEATLAGWTSGEHILYIRGQDGFGNWGLVGSAVLNLDKLGPEVYGVTLKPNPTNGSVDVALSATADDRANGDSNVVAAEYRLDGGPWQPAALNMANSPFVAASGLFDAATIASLAEGQHLVEVRAQDDLGNWSFLPGQAMLQVDKTGPNVSNVTLNPNQIDLGEPLAVAYVKLRATVSDPLANGVQSNLRKAEGFIGTVGAPGTGFALFPADGLFDEPVEEVYYNIPAVHFSTLAPGVYPVWVVGQDRAGNWGPAGSANMTLLIVVHDVTGPAITNLNADPNPTRGRQRVTLTAIARDPGLVSNVIRAQWFRGTNPVGATKYEMTASDGAFDSPSEAIRATINVARWRIGIHTVSVRARDAEGNWGPVQSIQIVVTPF